MLILRMYSFSDFLVRVFVTGRLYTRRPDFHFWLEILNHLAGRMCSTHRLYKG